MRQNSPNISDTSQLNLLDLPNISTSISLSQQQKRDWLRLYRSENVGPISFKKLINRYGSAARAVEKLPDLVARGGKRTIHIASEKDIEQELEALEKMGGQLVAIGEPAYPSILRHSPDAPPLLSLLGNADVGQRPCLSIVGSRNASASGKKLCERIIDGLAAKDLTIVSGLARGIDAYAHQAALKSGTIAVFAGGLDHVYPSQNAKLAREIVQQGGLLVSEMALGRAPRTKDFPRRNRIIAGLGLGTLVIEANLRSGSLITARLANEMGRDVFAVPGSPLDPRAHGCNELLAQGAHMARHAQDILQVLSLTPAANRFQEHNWIQDYVHQIDAKLDAMDTTVTPNDHDHLDENERTRILSSLGPTPVTLDELALHAQASIATVHQVILELELAGRIHRAGPQAVSLNPG